MTESEVARRVAPLLARGLARLVVERAADTPRNGDQTPLPAGGLSAGAGVGGPLGTRPEPDAERVGPPAGPGATPSA